MRLFVSISLPDYCINELMRVQQRLQALGLFEGKLITPENLHCTIAFLGTIGEEELATIIQDLSTISYPTFTVQLGTLGANSHAHPRVLWVTLTTQLLEPLALLIAEKVPKAQQERSFNGHVTIARIKRVIDKKELSEALDTVSITPFSWQVQSFDLVASQTLPEGPVYTPIATFKLLGSHV